MWFVFRQIWPWVYRTLQSILEVLRLKHYDNTVQCGFLFTFWWTYISAFWDTASLWKSRMLLGGRASTHGVIGHQIILSWWTHGAISHSRQGSIAGVTKPRVWTVLPVGWCIEKNLCCQSERVCKIAAAGFLSYYLSNCKCIEYITN